MSVRQVKPHMRFPSGDYRDLAELPFSPAELTKRYGLKLEDGADYLDTYKIAAIELPDHSQAWFIKYQGDDDGGTLVRVDVGLDPTKTMMLLEHVMRLRESDFPWINPDVQISVRV